MRTRGWGVGAVASLLVLAACAAPNTPLLDGAESSAPPTSSPTERAEQPVALVVTVSGLAGVPVAAATPAWTVDGAVAAPDGSAVFALGPASADAAARDVVRIDPRSGAQAKVGDLVSPSSTRISAVEPGGGRIVLVTPDGSSTVVRTYDTTRGTVEAMRTFEGTLDPEAFSVDRNRLFAARVYGDYYNVHVLDLTTGEQYPTLGPDKTKPPEDMYGTVVQAALSEDRTQLATLYRDATKPGRTAFVHLLFLDSGSTFCIDLHAPFATAGPGTDAIEWRAGRIVVGHRPPDGGDPVAATMDPQAVLAAPPQQHYPADAQVDASAPSLPAGVGVTPGFERFVALVPGQNGTD